MNRRLTTLPTIAGLAAIGLVLAACGSDDAAEETSSPAESSPPMTASPSEAPSPSAEATMTEEAAPAMDPVGPGCAALADSLASVAGQPLTSAVGGLPELSTLASAVSGGLNPDVDVTDALSVGNMTVFAPTNEAFEALDPATLETFGTDMAALSVLLNYHVVPELLTPEDIVGTQITLAGSAVAVEGEPDALTVNNATVVCGGIALADAQVYVIDAVLDPAAAPAVEETPDS